MIFYLVEREGHELRETTQICLYKEKDETSKTTFQTFKVIFEKNETFMRKELEIFQLQNKEIKFLHEIILSSLENQKKEEISIENECLSEKIKYSKPIFPNEEKSFINKLVFWEHYYQIKNFEKNGLLFKMKKTAIENTRYIKVELSIQDNKNQILLKSFELQNYESKNK